MKRLLALGVMSVFSLAAISAETATLIDFNQLTDDADGNNQATLMDFSGEAGSGFTQEEKDQMKTSLFIGNWVAELNHSAQSRENNRLTQVKPVQSSYLGGATTMGIRVHFPQSSSNANVTVRPPFSIPAIEPAEATADNTDNTAPAPGLFTPTKFDNKGLVKNVGVLKSVSMNVRGLNFPQTTSILLTDFNGKVSEIPMGSLDFDGWKTLTWTNPAYIYEVRKRDLKKAPLYPYTIPLIKLSGIRFYKDNMHDGGDFITYVKDIVIVYDKAVRDDVPQDIDDEATWEILAAREQIRREHEMKNFAERQVLDFIEMKLIDTSTTERPLNDKGVPVNSRTNTPAGGNGGNANAGA